MKLMVVIYIIIIIIVNITIMITSAPRSESSFVTNKVICRGRLVGCLASNENDNQNAGPALGEDGRVWGRNRAAAIRRCHRTRGRIQALRHQGKAGKNVANKQINIILGAGERLVLWIC